MTLVFGSPEAVKVLKADKELKKRLAWDAENQPRVDELKERIANLESDIYALEMEMDILQDELYGYQGELKKLTGRRP